MNEIDRRNFLALWFQALLLALFPMLRPKPEAALKVAEGLVDRMVFKGGSFKLSVILRGFEVDEDWYQVLRADPELRKAVLKDSLTTFAEPDEGETPQLVARYERA